MTAQMEAVAIFHMADGERIHVRPIEQADLLGLEWDGEFKHFRNLYKQHYESFKNGSSLIYVAETEAKVIVGQVFLLLVAKETEIADGVHRAYLFSFRIKPEWRNQGLGSFMLQFCEDQLMMRGFSSIRLNVGRANPWARRLYEKFGYRMTGPDSGTWRYQDDNGEWQTVREPAWKMVKQLR